MFRSLKKKFLLGSLIVILTTTIGATFCYLMAETEVFVNVFKPFLSPYGNLKIEKTVEHPFGDEYVLPEDLAFDFTVDLGEANAGKEFDSSLGSKVKADSEGVIGLEVKPGIPVTIKDIPAETDVIVTEVQNKEGFKVEGESSSQSVAILPVETKTLSFTNVYTPQEVQNPEEILELLGTKKLEGREWLETDEFSFELKQKVYDEQKKEEVWKVIDTVKITDDTPFDFADAMKDIVFDEAKIYSFAVSEVEGDIEGITYDKREVLFDIVVGDADMDGFYEIQSVENEVNANKKYDKDTEAYTLEMEFVNTYQETPNPTTEAVIEINKSLKDAEGKERIPAGFSFEVYEGEELVKTSEATTAAGEAKVILGPYDRDDVGKVYNYTVKEVNAGKTINGVTYDRSEYEVTVAVEENLDGTLQANVSGDQMTFENIYQPEPAEPVEITGTKIYEGNTLEAGAFSFALYETDEQFEVEGTAEPVETVLNDEKGGFSFDELSFEKAGMYHYTVKEVAEEPATYVEYDKTVYLVTISVKDVGGKLKSEVYIMDEYGEEKAIEFVNVYQPLPAYVTLTGSKILEGKELTEGMFRFWLYEADEEYQAKGDVLQMVSHNAGGEFTFDELTFTEAGEYIYLVKEDTSQPTDNVTYDDTVYVVKVTVTDDKEGTLKAVTKVMLLDGTDKEEIVFKNTYSTTDEPDDPDAPDIPDNPDNPDTPGEPDDSTGSDQSGTGETKTGDATKTFLYLTMLFGSGAVILGIYTFVIRKRKEM